MSSADPYLKILIGDGKNDPLTKQVKYIDDSENRVRNTLNPNFFSIHELDASFPDDW